MAIQTTPWSRSNALYVEEWLVPKQTWIGWVHCGMVNGWMKWNFTDALFRRHNLPYPLKHIVEV